MKTRLSFSIFSCLSLLAPSIAFSATLGSSHLVADAHHSQKHASEHHDGGASGQEIDVLQLANTCSADAPLEGDGSGGSQCGTDDGDAGLSYITGDDEGGSLSDERILGSHVIMRDTDDNCTDTATAKEPVGALCVATDTNKLYRYNGSSWDEVLLSAVASHTVNDTANDAVTDVMTFEKTTSGSPNGGIGVGLSFKVEDPGGSEQQASIDVILTVETNGSEDSDMIFSTRDSGASVAEVGRFIGDLGSFKVANRLSSIGGAELDYARTLDTGSFTSGGASTVAYALSRTGALTLASGDTGVSAGTYLNNTFTTSGASEVATTIAQLSVNEPQITVATETVTNSAAVYIIAAATEASNDYALWVDAGVSRFDGNVGVGTETPGALLHVESGAGTAPTLDVSTVNGLLVQRNSSAGHDAAISIIGGATGNSILNFGDVGDEDMGALTYDHTNNELNFRTAASTQMQLDASGHLGIGLADPDGTFHAHSASSGSVTADAAGDEGIFENSGDAGITILSGNANNGAVIFGDDGDNNIAFIDYDHNTNIFSIVSNTATQVSIASNGLVTFSQDVVITDLAAAGSDPLCWDGSGDSLIGDCTSLREWKTNITDTEMGLAEVLRLRAREFDWDEQHGHGRHDFGFVAEEVEEVSPLLVTYRPELTGVKYNRLTALLVKAIQELEARVAELEQAAR